VLGGTAETRALPKAISQKPVALTAELGKHMAASL